MTDTVNAVVLAGGRSSEAMQAATGVENRALALIGGKTMLEWVVDALRGAQSVRAIVIVGDVPDVPDCRVLPAGLTLVDNLYAGIGAAGLSGPVLVVTSDIPFLTPIAADDFVARAAATDAAFCYPIIPLSVCQARFPQMKRTSLRLREGTFTGGNVMLLDSSIVLRQRETILRAYAARKSPVALGRMLGWGLAAKIALSQACRPQMLSVAELERAASRVLGCRAAAVVSEFAEIGTDVDKPDDLAAARASLDMEKIA